MKRTPAPAIRELLTPGDTAYLVPRTIGPPTEAWRNPPPAVVVKAVGQTDITVTLDGRDITTNKANVVRRRPSSTTTTARATTPPAQLDARQVTAW